MDTVSDPAAPSPDDTDRCTVLPEHDLPDFGPHGYPVRLSPIPPPWHPEDWDGFASGALDE